MADEQVLTNEETVTQPEGTDVPRETAGDDGASEKARKLGWKPKEEYLADGGREDKWSPPEQFLEIKERTAKERVKENQRLEKKLAIRDRELDEVKKQLAEMRDAMAQQSKARTDIQSSALWSQREQALAAGDAGEVNRLDKEILELRVKQNGAPAAAAPQQQFDPRIAEILTEFGEEHPEYQRPDMQRLLGITFKELKAVDPNMDMREALEEAHDIARVRFSHKYTTTNGNRPRAAMAETGGTPAVASNGAKSWNDLKPEAKQALDRLISTAPTYANMKPEQVAAAKARMVKNASPDMFKGGR